MSKFKVGDKVVRKAHKNNSSFKTYLGDFSYYVITDITASGHWMQLDNFTDGGNDPYPWYAEHFELYQEKGDELPPVPASVYYPDMFELITGHGAIGGTAGLEARVSPLTPSAVSLSIDDSKWTRLDADAALQLAHDLRRMAMGIKRKEKAQ